MLAFWRRGYESTSMSDLVAALGIASARIYAAFGSKEDLFREAVALYTAGDGGFADLALRQEEDVAAAIERMLHDAVMLYTQPDSPQGCMVVSAATNCSEQNDGVLEWLRAQRHERTQSVMNRLRRGVADGQLGPDTDVDALAISTPCNCTASRYRRATACRASGSGGGARRDDAAAPGGHQALKPGHLRRFKPYRPAATPETRPRPNASRVSASGAPRAHLGGAAAPVLMAEDPAGRAGHPYRQRQRGAQRVRPEFRPA